MCVHVHTHTRVSAVQMDFLPRPLLWLLRAPGSSNFPLAVSTSSTRTLASMYHSPLQEPGFLGDTAGCKGKCRVQLGYLVAESKEMLRE